MTPELRKAVWAAQDRKARDLNLLNLKGISSFTDYFLICTGTSNRHMQAISEAIVETLEGNGVRAAHIEGGHNSEWILLDYLDFVVHIFSERARDFYELERLWKSASREPVPTR